MENIIDSTHKFSLAKEGTATKAPPKKAIEIPKSTLQESPTLVGPKKVFNILILGETGVGKSTWINGIVNYVTYPSLQQAIETGSMSVIIPFK